MITEWLLDMLQKFVSWAVSPLPDDSTNPFKYLQNIADNLTALDYFLPIHETVAVVVAVFALFPVFLGITLALWVGAQLRGSSSVG